MQNDFKTVTDGFADRLIPIENKISDLERDRPENCSNIAISDEFANHLGTLRQDDNQPMEIHNEIGTEVGLSSTRVAGRLETVETHMATVSRIQTSKIKGRAQKTEGIYASPLSHQLVEDEISSGEELNDSEAEVDSESSNSKKENSRPQRKKPIVRDW